MSIFLGHARRVGGSRGIEALWRSCRSLGSVPTLADAVASRWSTSVNIVEGQDLAACMSGSASGLGAVGRRLGGIDASVVLPAYSLQGRLSGLWRVEPSGGGHFLVRSASTLLEQPEDPGGLVFANGPARRQLERGRMDADRKGWVVDGVAEYLLLASSEETRRVPIVGIPDGSAGAWARQAAELVDAERIVVHDDLGGWRMWVHFGLGRSVVPPYDCVSVGPRIPLLGKPAPEADVGAMADLGEPA